MVTSCCSSPASLFNAFQALCVLFPWFSLISSSVWDSVPSCCSWMFEPSLGLLGPSNTLTNLDVSPHPLQPFLIALICLPAVPSLSLSLSLSLSPSSPTFVVPRSLYILSIFTKDLLLILLAVSIVSFFAVVFFFLLFHSFLLLLLLVSFFLHFELISFYSISVKVDCSTVLNPFYLV